MAKGAAKKAKLEEAQRKAEQTKKEIAEKLRLAGKAGTCSNCGKTFEINRAWQRFCSAECRLEYWKKKRTSNLVRELTCPVCNTKFSTTDGRRVYCSNQCYRKASNEMAKSRHLTII